MARMTFNQLTKSLLMLSLGSLSLLAVKQALSTDNSVLNVQVTHARLAYRPEYLKGSGLIKPWDAVKVDSQIGDVPVISAPLRVGDSVHKGELLVLFSCAAARAQLALAKASLAEAQAVYADAKINERRAIKLEQAGMLSAQNILDIRTRTAVAKDQVTAAKARLRVAALTLEHTRVRAPFSGIISARLVNLGEVPQAGSELYSIIRRGKLQWQAQLTARQLSRLRTGLPAYVKAANGKRVSGVVSDLSPALTASSQTGLAYVTLNKSAGVRAGMYVTGAIRLALRPVVLVPSASIVTRNARSYAVTYAKGHALFVPVTLGHQGALDTEVLSGLKPGSLLIDQGAGLLDNGAPVTVVK